MLILITQSAKDRIKSMVEDYFSENGIEPYVQLSVRKMGCSGFSHLMQFVTQKPEIATIEGTRLFVEPKSMIFLVGTAVDYIDEEVKSGFIFKNPSDKGSCHCGKAVYR